MCERWEGGAEDGAQKSAKNKSRDLTRGLSTGREEAPYTVVGSQNTYLGNVGLVVAVPVAKPKRDGA